MRRNLRAVLVPALALAVACGPLTVPWGAPPAPCDVVILGGRIMDPESGLDAVRSVCVRDGRIAAISETPAPSRATLYATGLVVAPGFIDLHAHGQDERSRWLKARDGVTTALDMEVGVNPVGAWYAEQEGRSPIHYGASIGHIPARGRLKHGIDAGHPPTSSREMKQLFVEHREWAYEPADAVELDRLAALLEAGLGDGAPGIGLAIQYTPGARREEVLRVFEVAGRAGAPVFVHTRSIGMTEPGSSIEAVQELLADAAATGAPLHIVHVTSSGLGQTHTILAMIEGARAQGFDVTTEAYPYGAASTQLSSAFFDTGWQKRLGIDYGDLQWAATGRRLDGQSFARYRKQPGSVIAHMIPEHVVLAALASPVVMIASDGLPFLTGGEHPRGAGTFARVLGRYVREKGTLGLMDALGKMTLMPAERLGRYVPAMRRKGRIRVGADADLVVFDPERIVDRATYEDPMLASEGIRFVLVAGTVVVRDGVPMMDARPGQPVRRGPPSRGPGSGPR